MKKHFIITIDTESDNQWVENSKPSTENSKFIPRFQELCEKYGFVPVYLTDYSMANDDYYVGYVKEKQSSGLCEVGMHLHAWDTPPLTNIDRHLTNKPYITEYSDDVVYDKVATLTDILETKLGVKMVSHRAGRWATDERYFTILEKKGYLVDCSVTPGINWSNNIGFEKGGSDYSVSSVNPYFLTPNNQLLEVPMTIRNIHTPIVFKQNNLIDLLKSVKRNLKGRNVWIRPSISTNIEMKALLKTLEKEDTDYAEFMMHSSEFMPGGSPYFETKSDVDQMFINLEQLFCIISEKYEGISLKDYYDIKIQGLI